MTPVVVLLRVLLAGLLSAVALAAAPVTGASAHPSGSAPCRTAGTQDYTQGAAAVFTGRVLDVTPTPPRGQARTYLHQVRVDMVFQGDLTQRRVDVLTRRDTRAEPGIGRVRSGEDYAFFVEDGDPYVARGCGGTQPASRRLVAELEQLTQAPPEPDREPPSASFTPVGVDEPASLTRAAAPGLALVIVGLLGLFVAARLSRRRG